MRPLQPAGAPDFSKAATIFHGVQRIPENFPSQRDPMQANPAEKRRAASNLEAKPVVLTKLRIAVRLQGQVRAVIRVTE